MSANQTTEDEMSKTEKTPLEIAREAWELEWTEEPYGQSGLPVIEGDGGALWVQVELEPPDEDGLSVWRVQVNPFGYVAEDVDLATAILRAKAQAAEGLGATLALCAPAYPVPVARHPGTGEAVLMLTDEDGTAYPVAVLRLLAFEGPPDDDDDLVVLESAADIRATLEMLRAEQGGEE